MLPCVHSFFSLIFYFFPACYIYTLSHPSPCSQFLSAYFVTLFVLLCFFFIFLLACPIRFYLFPLFYFFSIRFFSSFLHLLHLRFFVFLLFVLTITWATFFLIFSLFVSTFPLIVSSFFFCCFFIPFFLFLSLVLAFWPVGLVLCLA